MGADVSVRSTAVLAMVALVAAGLPASAVPARPADGTTLAAVDGAVVHELASDGTADYWVLFDDRPDLSDAYGIDDWADRGQYVYDRLTATARASQAGLLADLADRGIEAESFWITNAVRVRGGDQASLEAARSRVEVAAIVAPRQYERPEPVAQPDPGVAAVEWGIDDVRAPEVWDTFGVRGSGITVANIDTGVQFDHPALVGHYRGNLGDGTFDHNYNWFDATGGTCPEAPCDPDGHGTHTMGTMVGEDADQSNQIGVAPGATWIAANGCVTCSDDHLIASGQWLLAPTDLAGDNPRPDLRPHIINNSWGSQFPSTDPFMEDVLAAWDAAGIFSVWSNGNSGPFCGSSSSPGSRTIAYSVGAYGSNGAISFFSGRGPGQDGEIKPNIAAPGANIRSSLPGDRYGPSSGTSMAAPHVAGTVALMWSASPDLVGDTDQTRSLLDESAVDVDNTACGGDADDNNVWGEGRLDAFAAVDHATRGPVGTLTGAVTDGTTGDAVAGATVTVLVHGQPRSATADTNGVYTLDSIPVGAWPARASATGYRQTAAQQVRIAEDRAAVADFTLAPLPELTGTVTDASTGEPIAGATVESTTAGVHSTTSSDGTYRMRLNTGRHTVTVAADGYASQSADVTVVPGTNDHSPELIRLPVGAAWSSEFFAPGVDDNILATTVWDDGSGPALYAGGLFRTAGGQVVNRIARWDGSNWSPLTGPSGTGVDAQVFDLAVYDGDLIVAGSFIDAGGVAVNRIARWDGTQWAPVGTGVTGTVRALTVYDGELIAAGSFTQAGGVPVGRVARWDGTRWAPVGSGVDSGTVLSLSVYDGDLIAGGNFRTVGGQTMNRIARWDGNQWSPLGGGLLGSFAAGVNALTVHDGSLIAGGSFSHAGDTPVDRIARWDGNQWSALAGSSGTGMNDTVNTLTVFDGALIAGGAFSEAGGTPANRIARWDGSDWAALTGPSAAGVDGHSVLALTVFDDTLIAAGAFGRAGGAPVNRIAGWDGARWSPLAALAGTGLNGSIEALVRYDGDVIAGGRFTQAGGQVVNHIARWDGDRWTPLGPPGGASPSLGVDGYVWALAVYDGQLIAGGQFTRAGDGVVVNNIARWDGHAWSPLAGSTGTGVNGSVRALAVVDGELIAGGQFTEAGGTPASRVASWNGSEWSPLAAGVSGGFSIPVQDLEVYQGALVAAGQFTRAGGQTVNNIARWDGSSWTPLTGSSGTGVNQRVQALSVYRGDLIVGGSFTEAGGKPANWIARWDGSDWSPFASELSGGCCAPFVRSLTVFDGTLVAGGVFTQAGGETVNTIARWDGARWSALDGPAGTGMSGGLSDTFLGNPDTSVNALTTVDADGPGLLPESLVAGGSFSVTGGVTNWGIAFYGAPIGLVAEPYLLGGEVTVDLTWAGSTTSTVDVYRDGERIATVLDDGRHTDELGRPAHGTTALYWICEADSDVCSEEVVVDVDPRGLPTHRSSEPATPQPVAGAVPS